MEGRAFLNVNNCKFDEKSEEEKKTIQRGIKKYIFRLVVAFPLWCTPLILFFPLPKKRVIKRDLLDEIFHPLFHRRRIRFFPFFLMYSKIRISSVCVKS